MRIFLLIIFALTSIMAHSQELPDDFMEEVLPYNLTLPIGFEFDNQGRCFIWEKGGKVKVIDSDGNQQEEVLIDISEEVTTFGDHGLVGFALHPNFHINGFFYMYYVVDRHFIVHNGSSTYDPLETIENQATIGRITRYKANFDNNVVADVSTRNILIGDQLSNGLPILMTSHGVGSLVFGQDGSLLLSFGDGGSFTESDLGNANDTYHQQAIEDGMMDNDQNVGALRSMLRNSPSGKILRIDPITGAGISSNPYYDDQNPASFKSMIWSMGFRNPYKFIHFPETGSHNLADADPGKFLVGDVGSAYWEELSIVEKPGEWFGWPYFEGYDGRYEYWESDLQHPEASSQQCENDLYQFRQLVKDERADGNYIFEDPCSSGNLLQDDTPRFIHKRPIFAYSNDLWNPPAKTRIGSFTDEGVATTLSVIDPSSNVQGQILEGGSIIPGGINRYDNFEGYEDHLFLGDFHGSIFHATMDENYDLRSISSFLKTDKGLTDLKFNPADGKLYYINIVENQMRRIQYGGILAPKIKLFANKEFGPSPLEVQFDASETIDYSDLGLSYHWDFGDGETSTLENPNHTYVSSEVQSYFVTLTVTDGAGNTSIKSILISINNTPPVAKITSVTDGQTYATNDYTILTLEGQMTDSEYPIEDLATEWRVDLYHDSHFHPGSIDNRVSTKTIIDPLGCGIENYWYQIYLTVTDPGGLSASDTVRLYPYCGEEIALLSLTGKKEESIIELTWNIEGNNSAQFFEVESTDEYLFGAISDKIPSEGSSQFQYSDTSPFLGDNYYRIKAIDDNGNYSYSDIIKVEFFSGEIIHSLQPNPTNGNFTLDISNIEDQEITFELFDFAGKTILRETIPNDGNTIKKNFFLDDVANGIYLYRLTVGEKSILSKVFIY